ncbi:MAG: AsmA family protein, partial [Acidobacteria bacterium]|nr:AsmA family protein [Acidobacteriota bacterium]
MRLGTKFKLAAGAILLVALILGVAHTPVMQNFVLERLRQALRADAGIELQAARLRYNLLTLSLQARGISLASVAAPELPPLLRLSALEARLRWPALLRGKLVADHVRLDGVALELVTDQRGKTNLPEGGKSAATTDPNAPLGFVIAQLVADRAALVVSDRRQSLELTLPQWRLRIDGNIDSAEHLVRFETTQPGGMTFKGRRAELRSLALDALLRAGLLEVKRFLLDAEGGTLAAAGVLKDFARPRVKAEATVEVDLARAAALAGVRAPTGGQVAAKVTAEGPLESLQVRLESFLLQSPVGTATARGSLSLEAAGTSWIEANLSNLNLERLSRQQDLPVRIASRATVSAKASWPALEFAQASGQARIRLEPTRTAPDRGVAPVAGTLAVSTSQGAIGLEVVSLESLGTRLEGEVRLAGLEKLGGQLRASVVDVGDTVAGVELALGKEEGALAAVPLQGGLELGAELGGTLEKPQVAATLKGSALRAGLIQDAALEASATCSPEEVRLEELSLAWQGQRLTASGVMGLRGRVPSVTASAAVSEASLAALLSGVGQTLPLDGRLDLKATLGGTLEDLQASLSLAARGLQGYGEEWGDLAVEASLAGQRAVLEKLRLDKPQAGGNGYLQASGSYDLASSTYSVKCEANQIAFEKLSLPDDVAIRGSLGLSLEGAGSLEDPALAGSVHLADVSVGEQVLGGLTASGRLDKGEARLEARLPRFSATLSGKASARAPHAAEFRIAAADTDLSRLGVSALEGSTSAVISGLGNLGEWNKFRAALSADPLRLKLSGQEVRNEGPLELALRENTLEVKSAALRSGNSRLSMQGRLPLEKGPAPSDPLRIQAAIDLTDLAAFAPSEAGVSAQGQLRLDAVVRGDFTKLDPTARLSLQDATLSQPELKEAVSGVNLEVEYASGAVEVRRLAAALGKATLSAHGTIPVGSMLGGLPLESAPPAGPAQFALELRDLDPQVWKGFPEQIAGRFGLRIEAEAAQLTDPKAVHAKATFPQLRFQIAELGQYELRQDGVSAVSLRNGRVAIDRLALTGPKTRLEAGGSMDL